MELIMFVNGCAATIDLGLLRTFLAVYHVGGFTTAARALNKTQSTVSLHIKRLENLVGYPLFERTTRKVELTEQGEILLLYAQDLIRINDEALLRFERPIVSGTIRIGVLEDFATALLPKALRRFKETYPTTKLTVQSALTSELYQGLKGGSLDIILARRCSNPEHPRALWREPLRWVGAANLSFATDPIPLIMFPAECVYRAKVLELLRLGSRPWEIVYTGTSLVGVQAAVAAGIGVSVLAQSEVLRSFSVFGAAEGLPELPETEVIMELAHKQSKAVDVMASYLTEAIPFLGASTTRMNAIDPDKSVFRERVPFPAGMSPAP